MVEDTKYIIRECKTKNEITLVIKNKIDKYNT